MLDVQTILDIAEITETGVDEQERHVFSDADLIEFAKEVLSKGTTPLLNAMDRMDHGCREPGWRGHDNGLGDTTAGDELQDALDKLRLFVNHQPVPEPALED
jgi:hypothetical protein